MTMTKSRRVASSPASASAAATPAPSQAQTEAVAVCPFDGESCLSKTSANKIAEKKSLNRVKNLRNRYNLVQIHINYSAEKTN